MTAIFNPTTMILPGVKVMGRMQNTKQSEEKLQKKPQDKSPWAVFSRSFSAFSCFMTQFPRLPFNAGKGVKIQRPDNTLSNG